MGTLYYICNFFVNLKLFQNKKSCESKSRNLVVIHTILLHDLEGQANLDAYILVEYNPLSSASFFVRRLDR